MTTEPKKQSNEIKRPPIVVVMGHIDHGKTTLLDFIRKTKVTEREAGGITQHVGAYEVMTLDKEGKEKKITFLDTPGHEAFSKIRSRGAKIADIAILIIAADDGVKQQTVEALDAIKDTSTPFIVAINKIDKENANPDKVKKELADKEIYLEGWGGQIPTVSISAKTGLGTDELLEMILLVTDMEELKTDPGVPASGVIIESRMDSKRGIAATLLIQNGTLKQGMCLASNDAVAPVRIFEDFAGKPIKEAGASSPIKIVGFNKLPEAGAEFRSFDSKKEAENSALTCQEQIRENIKKQVPAPSSATDETKEKEKIAIPLVIKTDVVGSKEAIEKQIKKLESEEISINILRSDVGDIGEDDIKLASSGKQPIIIGFHVKYPDAMKLLCERLNVEVKLFDIIYELENWLKAEIEKRKPAEIKTEILGHIKVLKIFGEEKNKKIVGGEVTDGKVSSNNYAKIFRRDFMVGEGRIVELRKFQTKIKEAAEGEQIGVLINTKTDIAPHDILEIAENPPVK